MNNTNSPRKLFIAAASGLAGFIILVSAIIIYLLVFFASSGFPFGGSSPSLGQHLILFGFVPLVVIFATGLPAWALGANLWFGFLSGVVATGIFVLVEFMVAKISSYGLFSKYDTVAFVTTVLTTVLIAAVNVHDLPLRKMAVLFTLGCILIGLRFIIPNDSIAGGGAISLLAWILLPSVTALFTISKQNR